VPSINFTSSAHLASLVRQAARKIVHALDGIPLAIEQASAYLSFGPISTFTLEEYFKLLESRYRELMSSKPDRANWYYEKNRSIISTFAMLNEAVAKKNADAAKLLTLSAFFASGNIPISMLTESDSLNIHPQNASSLEPWT